jgi:hypothetical protein
VLPTVARFEAMQKANQAFADQIKHSLASLDEFNRAFAGLETFSRIAEQQARLFQNGVASAISRAIESASEFPKIDWEAVARDLADAPVELAKLGWFITLNSPVSYHRRFLDMIRAGPGRRV